MNYAFLRNPRPWSGDGQPSKSKPASASLRRWSHRNPLIDHHGGGRPRAPAISVCNMDGSSTDGGAPPRTRSEQRNKTIRRRAPPTEKCHPRRWAQNEYNVCLQRSLSVVTVWSITADRAGGQRENGGGVGRQSAAAADPNPGGATAPVRTWSIDRAPLSGAAMGESRRVQRARPPRASKHWRRRRLAARCRRLDAVEVLPDVLNWSVGR